jgi:uncharacterized protein
MTSLDHRRILIFLGFAFGIAWACGLAVYLTGGLAGSPQIASGISLAVILLATVYMGAPAIAHILTRLITHEGWQNSGLRPHFRRSWLYWLAAWFGPGILTFAGLGIFLLIWPQYFDPGFGVLQKMLGQAGASGQTIPAMEPLALILLQSLQAVIIAPLLNGLSTFGEEFGWRAYLLPKLLPLGPRKAMLLMGLIWGMWHWPITAQGHNYGLVYPGAPWLGMLAMVWFTFVLGTFLGWASLRAGSVWPAVIGHGAINGIAGIGIFFVKGDPSPLLGPMPVGLIGSLGFSVVALVILLVPAALRNLPSAQTPAAA